VKVLVVEDDDAVSQTLQALLERWKIESERVRDVAGAREALDNGGIDLALCDVYLPGESGLELVKWVREHPRHRSLPLLLVSGQVNREDIVAASRLGIDGFVAKPFDADELRQRILEVYRTHRSARWARDAAAVWQDRTVVDGSKSLSGHLILFGEGVESERDLADPAQRPVTEYLALARTLLLEMTDGAATPTGYAIVPTTTEVILALKRPGVRDTVRALLVSTRCQGNPTLMARLFSINRRSHRATLYLVYDEVDEISPIHRQGLKDLGVRILRRSRIDEERCACC
jgi:DNA-binding response OmpR family regulator